MKLLLSGFEAFDFLKENPSQLLVESFKNKELGVELSTIILPVSFKKAPGQLKKRIDEFRPDVVISFGVATSREKITIERVAINLLEARIPDNEGYQPKEEAIIPNGPDGLFTTLPIQKMSDTCNKLGVSCGLSNTAGTYVCNALMYELLSYTKSMRVLSGFVHIPPLPKTVEGNIGMPLGKQEMGVLEMIKACVS